MFDFQWHDVVGNIGVVLIVATYLLLQLRRLSARSLSYSVLNGVGAALVLVSLSANFNLPATVVEVFWLLISLFGVVRWLIGKERLLI